MTERITSYEELVKSGKSHFLQKIEEKTIDGVINYIENPNTGGEFIIYNKDDTNKSNQLGKLYLYQGKLYILNDTKGVACPLPIDNFEDLNDLKNLCDIYYTDKEKPNELQPVYIEDENNIQTDKGVVISFDKIDSNNPNSNLYLKGIYNGEFKEQEIEIIDPKTKEKTTETKKMLTGNANIFYAKVICVYKEV